jgi:hypothetical protein
VRIVIRPPQTFPGLAQADIRVSDSDVTSISVKPEFLDAGAGTTPPASVATRVAGDAELWNATFWLLRRGSYGVEVKLDSARGGGRVAVPLQAAALAKPVMPPALGVSLVALGALLIAGAVWLAAAAARDLPLGPSDSPAARDRARGRVAAVIAALVSLAAVWGGNLRWQQMDRDFANALSKPLPVTASVKSDSEQRLLELVPGRDAPASAAWDTLVTDHGKLMHLFLIREPEFDAFAHLHPVRRDTTRFEGVLPPIPGGTYRLYAEVTHEDGSSETLVSEVNLPPPTGAAALLQAAGGDSGVLCLSPAAAPSSSAQPTALDFDDSWHLGASDPAKGRTAALMGGGRMELRTDAELVADRDTSLRFAAFGADGAPLALEPYMGMLGHAALRRSDGAVFTHLHPAGSISMAATEMLARRDGIASPMPAAAPAPLAHEVEFPYAFPRAGPYRIWVQVRSAGRVLTGVFDVDVRESS